MEFEFATARQIVFGAGASRQAGARAAALGRRALLVTGRSPRRAAPVRESLEAHGLAVTDLAVAAEPTVALVRAGTESARDARCDLVVAVGGGSALDAGKAIAAMLANGGDLLDHLEIVGRGRPLDRPSVPFIAIPTTAGTGAEVTRNAVLASPEHGVKVSLRSPGMLPALALVDPELTYGLPPAVTASTGLDALTQVLEPFVCNRPSPLTDAFCREGLRRAGRSLRRAFRNGDDAAAREDMALASLMGGLALANARLGAAHGFAAPIGGAFPAPHGAVCARLLPAVMKVNLRALERRLPGSDALPRYAEAARLLTGDPAATPQDGVAWVRELCRDLSIPPLSAYGLAEKDLADLAPKAAASSSMQGNPLPLTPGELAEIFLQCL